jgi:glycosyltransferase involved in cell wall biosynthesis
MASASGMLMPGRWFEAWGMTGPEAVSHGCAVTAWDTGGVKEWCREPWGKLVRYGDQPGLQAAAKSLLENSTPEIERAHWRETVISQWGLAAFGPKYAAIAARAAERAKAKRVIRVTHLERKPMPGFHSIEKLFATVRRALPGEIDVRVVRSPHDNGGLFKRMANSLAAARVEADVAHVVGDSHYLAMATDAKRTVLTVHDCISLHRASGLRRAVLKRLYFTGPVSRAAVTTAISPGTVADLQAQAGIDAGRVQVTPCCVSDRQPVAAQSDSSSVLLVGTLPHKNLERTITALKGTGLAVHVVGELSAGQLSMLKDSGLDWRNSTGLDDAGMAKAYADAGMLVFASTFEGFGLPIVEAQAAGVPVVSSALAPMDWVAGEGALLVDPTSEAAIREAVTHIAESEPLRQQLRERGLKNVQRFLPDAVAMQYADIYRELAT